MIRGLGGWVKLPSWCQCTSSEVTAVMNQMTHLQISNDMSDDIHLHCSATQVSQALLISLNEVSVVVIGFRAVSHSEGISRLVVSQHGDAFLAGPVQDCQHIMAQGIHVLVCIDDH